MFVYRFMSVSEFRKMECGATLHPFHNNFQARTISNGFCFMRLMDVMPECTYKFLSGIVTDDVCVMFDVPSNVLTESFGFYANPWDDILDALNDEGQEVREYCALSYNRDSFRPVAYAMPVHSTDAWRWYDFH